MIQKSFVEWVSNKSIKRLSWKSVDINSTWFVSVLCELQGTWINILSYSKISINLYILMYKITFNFLKLGNTKVWSGTNSVLYNILIKLWTQL